MSIEPSKKLQMQTKITDEFLQEYQRLMIPQALASAARSGLKCVVYFYTLDGDDDLHRMSTLIIRNFDEGKFYANCELTSKDSVKSRIIGLNPHLRVLSIDEVSHSQNDFIRNRVTLQFNYKIEYLLV